VPGSVLSKLSEGCHQLLRDGAKLTAHEQDVLEELDLESMVSVEQVRSDSSDGLTPVQTQLLSVLDLEPQTQDRLAELIGVSVSEVMRTLVELEIVGLVELGLGGYRIAKLW
jgi:DNA processing protein